MVLANWQIKKNKIDMEYSQVLQKYQVIYGAIYTVPLAVMGIIFSVFEFNSNIFFYGLFIGSISYLPLREIKLKIEDELENLKRRVNRI